MGFNWWIFATILNPLGLGGGVTPGEVRVQKLIDHDDGMNR